jgi:hypothetical protein
VATGVGSLWPRRDPSRRAGSRARAQSSRLCKGPRVEIQFGTPRGRVDAATLPADWVFTLRDRARVEGLEGTAVAIEEAVPQGIAVVPADEQARLHAMLDEWLPQLDPNMPSWSSVFDVLWSLRDGLAP